MRFKQTVIERNTYLYPERDNEVTESTDKPKFISEEEAFTIEFSWYPLLFIAANEQYLNIAKVVESPAVEFLHFCNFYKRKTELDVQRIKQGGNQVPLK